MTDKTVFYENSLQSVKSLFPQRNALCNKGDFGTAAIIGGSSHYVGAPQFAAEGASKTITALGTAAMLAGAGRSSLFVPDFMLSALYKTVKYSAVYGLPTKDGAIVFDKETFSKFKFLNTAFAIGNGAGEAEIDKYVSYILTNTCSNFVLDADGLKCANAFESFDGRAVLTPHAGEFSAMCGLSIAEVKASSGMLCKELAKNKNCVVVLKDAVSYISDGNVVYENKTGNVKLAKGGSGDVLSGIICGLLACGFKPMDAARAGVYVLGRCAELSAVNDYSNLPDDTLNKIADAIGELLN